MDNHFRQHATWNDFTRALGEFHVAYSWADKAVTCLLVFLLMGGDPNRALVGLYGMDARAKCHRVKTLAKGFMPGEAGAIAQFADGHNALTRYRNTLAHSCFEWHPKKHRFSLTNFGDDPFPSVSKATQPKQVAALTAKAKEAEALANLVYEYLAARDALSALDPDRPSRVIEVKASQRD